MEALISRPWDWTDRRSRDRVTHTRELDHVIDSLAKRQKELKARISQETGHSRLHRLNMALAVTDLQHKKALALRDELSH